MWLLFPSDDKKFPIMEQGEAQPVGTVSIRTPGGIENLSRSAPLIPVQTVMARSQESLS